jgi:NAD(P)-dependent dehydrogenase (short-subunit alcohol dehydrogenase family)
MAHTYLVTGASRGLGAEFVRQLRGAGHDVIAAVRQPDAARDAAGAGARVVPLDVTKPETFAAFASKVGAPVDVLVNNAGVAARDASLSTLSLDVFEDVFRTNVFGLALLTRALLPLLGRGGRRTIVNVSSSLGSLVNTKGGFSYAYCASKAALNLLTVQMHKELARDGFTVVSLDPGWNRTDMGGGQAPLDPRDTVRSMVALMGRFGRDDSGKFIGYDGAIRPW